MNIDYTAEIIGDQVIFKLTSINEKFPEIYKSEDGFLTITKVNGGSDGLLGYGALIIYFSNIGLPITIQSPHYEYQQDLIDILDKIRENMEIINGNVLP